LSVAKVLTLDVAMAAHSGHTAGIPEGDVMGFEQPTVNVICRPSPDLS
jgi:hypothetical protein